MRGRLLLFVRGSHCRAARGFERITHAENIQGNAFFRISVIVIQNKTAFLCYCSHPTVDARMISDASDSRNASSG